MKACINQISCVQILKQKNQYKYLNKKNKKV